MVVRSRALVLVPLILCGFSATVLASYPSPVADLLRKSGQSGVARAPNTIDDATKAQLDQIAKDGAAKSGAKVFLVIDNKTEPLEYEKLYSDLSLRGKDLLIASNGPATSLTCNALGDSQKQDLMNRVGHDGGKPLEHMRKLVDQATDALANTQAGSRVSWQEFEHLNAGRGWSNSQMSTEYAHYKQSGVMPAAANVNVGSTNSGSNTGSTNTSLQANQPIKRYTSTESHTGLWIFFVLVIAGIGGFVFYKRRNRDAGLAQEFKQALSGPQSIMADVYLQMTGNESGQLLDSANAVQSRIEALAKQAPSREGIAKANGLKDEANRIRVAFDRAGR